MIDVLVVNDNVVTRIGLRTVIDAGEAAKVVAECPVEQALAEVTRTAATVTVIELAPQLGQRVDLLTQLSRRTQLLVMTRTDRQQVMPALEAGAKGFLLYDCFEPDELISALRTVAHGACYLSPDALRLVLGSIRRAVPVTGCGGLLTAREREVMTLLSDGLASSAIAETLVLSEKTVKNHLANIYGRLAVSGRTEAILAWRSASGGGGTGSE